MIQLRYYQSDCVDAFWNYFQNATGNPIAALPTGTGKSLIAAEWIRRACAAYPRTRFILSSHSKEIIEQDHAALVKLWPRVNVGIHAASLKRRDTAHQIVFGTMQSIVSTLKKPKPGQDFGYRDILMIDECHLLSNEDEGTYQIIIRKLKDTNPNLKVMGLSATPWRSKGGLLTNEGGIFTDICYDLTSTESFNRLVAEGYLAPLIPKRTVTQINLAGVGSVGGEYNKAQLEAATNRDEVTLGAVRELIDCGQDRVCWLVFTTGIESAENVTSMLVSFGIDAACVHSKKKAAENDELIEAFQSGKLRCLVNSDMLTTGFDCPQIDMIGMLRATQSSQKWVQMLGRGTRPAEGKINCLVLDFASNTRRLGPINDVTIPPPPGEKSKPGDAPVKVCPECGIYNHASARWCINCATEFNIENKVRPGASDLELIVDGGPQVEQFEVDKVFYSIHKKPGKPDSMKVAYFSGIKPFHEFICFEHPGFAQRRAKEWWKQRHQSPAPATTVEALRLISELRKPARIKVWVNKPYPEVLAAEW